VDELLAWLSRWLPLLQGFAALASIAGALLSWKYALKAQRARDEMIRNVVSSRVIARFEKCLSVLREVRSTCVLPDGKPDEAAYRSREQSLKGELEDTLAIAKAAESYVGSDLWNQAMNSLVNASASPTSTKIEYVSKFLSLVTEQLKLSATTRELASH
jgi:hypothetical protein